MFESLKEIGKKELRQEPLSYFDWQLVHEHLICLARKGVVFVIGPLMFEKGFDVVDDSLVKLLIVIKPLDCFKKLVQLFLFKEFFFKQIHLNYHATEVMDRL